MASPTIRDVAKQAGVGIGTVSRVLNNSPKVTAETRQLVLATIAEMGFKPNNVARMLPRKKRIHNIGVITQPFVTFRAFAERLRGVQRALTERDEDYELVLYSVSSLTHYDERLRTIVQTGAVDGLIIIDLDLAEEQKLLLRDAQLPVVGLNHLQETDWPCIGTDNVAGGYTATRYLLDLGHRKIAYVGDEFIDTYGFKTSAERFAGCQQAMREAGLVMPERYIRLGVHDYEIARKAAAELLSQADRPSAIFAMSDIQALGCIAAAHGLGLNVPGDVSVIGYDDLEVSLHTGLTTIRQHLELSGQVGLDYLIRRLKGDDTPIPALPPLEVIVRQTTRAMG